MIIRIVKHNSEAPATTVDVTNADYRLSKHCLHMAGDEASAVLCLSKEEAVDMAEMLMLIGTDGMT